MSEMKCDRCGRTYGVREMRDLDRTLANPDADDPGRYGYHSVCRCGAEFWVDRWTIRDEFTVDDVEFVVSTVFLHMNHGYDDRDLWYESLVYYDGDSQVMERYETQEEAEAGHQELVEKLKSGGFELEPVSYGLKLEVSQDV